MRTRQTAPCALNREDNLRNERPPRVARRDHNDRAGGRLADCGARLAERRQVRGVGGAWSGACVHTDLAAIDAAAIHPAAIEPAPSTAPDSVSGIIAGPAAASHHRTEPATHAHEDRGAPARAPTPAGVWAHAARADLTRFSRWKGESDAAQAGRITLSGPLMRRNSTLIAGFTVLCPVTLRFATQDGEAVSPTRQPGSRRMLPRSDDHRPRRELRQRDR
jgi:hypothetical protein